MNIILCDFCGLRIRLQPSTLSLKTFAKNPFTPGSLVCASLCPKCSDEMAAVMDAEIKKAKDITDKVYGKA